MHPLDWKRFGYAGAGCNPKLVWPVGRHMACTLPLLPHACLRMHFLHPGKRCAATLSYPAAFGPYVQPFCLHAFILQSKKLYRYEVMFSGFEAHTGSLWYSLLSQCSFPLTCPQLQILAPICTYLCHAGKKLCDHKFLFSGFEAHAAWAAEFLALAIAAQTGTTVLEARSQIWLVDGKGLVTRERGDAQNLDGYKLPFCHRCVCVPIVCVRASCVCLLCMFVPGA